MNLASGSTVVLTAAKGRFDIAANRTDLTGDVLITTTAAVCITVFLFATNLLPPRTTLAIFMLLFFIIRIPYYVMAELAWNDQTLGKKWMKIKKHNAKQWQRRLVNKFPRFS